MEFLTKILAPAVRKQVEEFAKWVDLGDPSDLCGYCGVASYFLYMAAKHYDYDVDIVVGISNQSRQKLELILKHKDTYPLYSDHCWIEYNGYVIDLTATQYRSTINNVRVLKTSGRIYRHHYFPLFRNNMAFKNLKEWGMQSPQIYVQDFRQRIKKMVKTLPKSIQK